MPHVELEGGGVEVPPGGRLDAIGAPPEVDGVEVALEDLVLVLRALELDGQHGLADLADDGALAAEVLVLDQLLGEG